MGIAGAILLRGRSMGVKKAESSYKVCCPLCFITVISLQGNAQRFLFSEQLLHLPAERNQLLFQIGGLLSRQAGATLELHSEQKIGKIGKAARTQMGAVGAKDQKQVNDLYQRFILRNKSAYISVRNNRTVRTIRVAIRMTCIS